MKTPATQHHASSKQRWKGWKEERYLGGHDISVPVQSLPSDYTLCVWWRADDADAQLTLLSRSQRRKGVG